ncbi:hypothetical protein GA0115254_11001, partial [Streptomyces sp. Ncost-T10-10d]
KGLQRIKVLLPVLKLVWYAHPERES